MSTTDEEMFSNFRNQLVEDAQMFAEMITSVKSNSLRIQELVKSQERQLIDRIKESQRLHRETGEQFREMFDEFKDFKKYTQKLIKLKVENTICEFESDLSGKLKELRNYRLKFNPVEITNSTSLVGEIQELDEEVVEDEEEENQQLGQIFPSPGAGYFMPMARTSHRGFYTPQMARIRPAQDDSQTIPKTSVRRTRPTQPAWLPRSAVNARPIAGQQPLQRLAMEGKVQVHPTSALQPQPTYKYTQAIPQQAVHIQGKERLTASCPAAAPLQEQKQMLGERLFPLIERKHPELAGKITGMLLEIDNSELLHMLEFPESLYAKTEEAVAVLQAHQTKEVEKALNYRKKPKKIMPQQAVHIQGKERLTASRLAAAPLQEQKQMLGERLFPLIERKHPELASKITGMLLEIDNSELLHMLESPASLYAKTEEAVAVLQAYQPKEVEKALNYSLRKKPKKNVNIMKKMKQLNH